MFDVFLMALLATESEISVLLKRYDSFSPATIFTIQLGTKFTLYGFFHLLTTMHTTIRGRLFLLCELLDSGISHKNTYKIDNHNKYCYCQTLGLDHQFLN